MASIVISQIAIIKKIKSLVMYVPFVRNLKENNYVGKEYGYSLTTLIVNLMNTFKSINSYCQ